MKLSLQPSRLPFFTLGASGLAFVLQLWLHGSVNDLALLPTGHISQVLSFILMALFLATLFLFVRKLNPISSYAALYPASPLRGIGSCIGGIGLLYSAISLLPGNGFSGVLGLILGVFSAVALCIIGFCRYTGKQPNGWLHFLPMAYLVLFAILQVAEWSRMPQTASYLYPLLATIFLLLAALYRAKLSIRLENRRWMVFVSQAAVFFCCGALASGHAIFYLCMAAWMSCDCCTLKNLRKREKPQEEQE